MVINDLEGSGASASQTAALVASPSSPSVSTKGFNPLAEVRVAIQRGLIAELGDTYDCTRVWSAWSYGTMGEDDFTPVLDRLDDLINTIVAEIAATPLREWDGPMTSEEQAMIDAAWEKHNAAAPEACPHAAPLVYCAECVVTPCPVGLGK